MGTVFNFEPIKNIVNQNSSNSATNSNGDVDTDYSDLFMSSIHLVLPIRELSGAIGVSVFAPMFYLALNLTQGILTYPSM